jgi:Zn-dependent peptidase ImmA (M78 family)
VEPELSPQQHAAEAIRHELDLGHGLVDPFVVADQLGIELVRFPVVDGSLEGMYRPTELGGYIFVNSQAVYVRQRFTAAHELGHHRLHGTTTFVESTIDAPDDWEANRFAEAFLVDPTGVRRLLAGVEHDVASMVARTCDEYWVSPSASGIALKRFGVISEPELASFLAEGWSYASILTANGLRPRPDPEPGATALPGQFRDRVLRLVELGQLSPERGGAMLEVEVESLPSRTPSPDPLSLALLADLPDSFD